MEAVRSRVKGQGREIDPSFFICEAGVEAYITSELEMGKKSEKRGRSQILKTIFVTFVVSRVRCWNWKSFMM